MSDPVIVAHVPDSLDGVRWALRVERYAVCRHGSPCVGSRRSHGFDRVQGRERTCRGYRVTTNKELQVKSAAGAKTLFGSGAGVLDGVRLSTLHPLTNGLRKSYTNNPSQL